MAAYQAVPKADFLVKDVSQPYSERVSVTFCVLGPNLRPDQVTERIGLKPTSIVAGTWCLETNPKEAPRDTTASPRIASSNVNEHIRCLVGLLLPLKGAIAALGSDVSVVVHVRWESNPPLGGDGPMIEADCLHGLAELGAGLVFGGPPRAEPNN